MNSNRGNLTAAATVILFIYIIIRYLVAILCYYSDAIQLISRNDGVGTIFGYLRSSFKWEGGGAAAALHCSERGGKSDMELRGILIVHRLFLRHFNLKTVDEVQIRHCAHRAKLLMIFMSDPSSFLIP